MVLGDMKVTVLEWPPNSPDLSPIENAWAIVSEKIQKKKFKSFGTFKAGLINEWNEIELKVLRSLIDSMPKRLELVLAGNGERIGY